MSKMLRPSVSRNLASRSRMLAWTVTSRAVVGSSAINRAGRIASADAISTR